MQIFASQYSHLVAFEGPTVPTLVVHTVDLILVDVNPVHQLVCQVQSDAARVINLVGDQNSSIAAVEQRTGQTGCPIRVKHKALGGVQSQR